MDPFKKERVETCDELVEFPATNNTARQPKDDMLSFLKESLLSKATHEKTTRNSFVCTTPSLVDKIQSICADQGLFITHAGWRRYVKKLHKAADASFSVGVYIQRP